MQCHHQGSSFTSSPRPVVDLNCSRDDQLSLSGRYTGRRELRAYFFSPQNNFLCYFFISAFVDLLREMVNLKKKSSAPLRRLSVQPLSLSPHWQFWQCWRAPLTVGRRKSLDCASLCYFFASFPNTYIILARSILNQLNIGRVQLYRSISY